MSTFSTNPLFLFVDDLADSSPNFATQGKIVELSDTGCDARAPGAAFETVKKPDAIIRGNGSIENHIPSVRRSLNGSLPQVKKNTSPAGHECRRQNIAGTRRSPIQGKLMTWDPRAKEKVATEGKDAQVKTGINEIVNVNDAKVSELSKQVGPNTEQKKLKPNSTRTLMSCKYGERYQAVKSQSISSSVPKQYKVQEAGSTICKTFVERSKTTPTKSMANPRTKLPMKMSKVTSEASLSNGMKRFVNRAVEKDSLSNCSRQLEIAKTSGAQAFPKTVGYASRLPRSAGAPKLLPKGKTNSDSPVLIGTEKEGVSKEVLMKIVGGTDHELQHEELNSKTSQTSPAANSEKRKDFLEGKTTGEISQNESPILNSLRKHGDEVNAKLSLKTRDVDDKNTMTLSPSRSTMTASKMPLPRFGRKPLIGDEIVWRSRNPDEMKGKSKSSEKLPSKMEKNDTARCRDSDSKLSASGNLATYPEKVSARPSAKCHNLIPREGEEAKNTTIGFQSKLSKPRTPSIVPKLMNEFRIQQKKHNEVLRSSPSRLAVPSISSKVKFEGPKLRTEADGDPHTSGILGDQLNDRLRSFSDRVREVSDSQIPLLSGVTECTGIVRRSLNRFERSTSKMVTPSGVKAVEEKDEEIELKSVFGDTSAIASRKPTPESSPSIFEAGKTTELKLRHPSPCSPATGSKVPRPVATKPIPRKEMSRNFPARTLPRKKESSIPRGGSKKLVKSVAKQEANPSTTPAKKFMEHVPESKDVPDASVVADSKEDDDEDVIPIMNPALYNMNSFVTQYRKRGTMENTVPQETSNGKKLESWIEGHEQAYLRGRAIGLKVASMARAAKEDLKREFVRIGLKSTSPISLPDKSQEIIDIGLSVIERALAEKENNIHPPSMGAEQSSDYHDFDKNFNWSSGQWFM